jgi:natural product biosynthesis luciferase-like monooxygenase protein
VKQSLAVSLLFFSGDGATTERHKYRLLVECAKYADEHDFSAVWIPERHFKPFGGLYPNPSVLAAALAMVTSRIQLRAGSVVLPLQNPLRVVEEWSTVSNLSGGRVGVSFASGWHPDDFALAPELYVNRRDRMFREIHSIVKLWKGERLRVRNGNGADIEVRTYPIPLQDALPIWITANSEETFIRAGELGYRVLTGLIQQGMAQCGKRIRLYREALQRHGHGQGYVTLMLHTYVAQGRKAVKEKVREPFQAYLRTFIDMSQPECKDAVSADDQDAFLAHAFERYFLNNGLFGSPEECQEIIDRVRDMGVDEVACLLDFGLDADSVLDGLRYLNHLRMANR